MTRRRPLREIEELLGLPWRSVRAVERRKNGDYAILLRTPGAVGDPMPRWAWGRRVLRIPARRVEGYRPQSPSVRPRDVRARRKASARRFAWWLFGRVGFGAPVVDRVLRGGDFVAVDELRAAILAAAPEPELVGVVLFIAHNGDGGRAA